MVASAHGFGALYNLPVPFWLYGWSAAAAVILSFMVACLFLTGAGQRDPKPQSRDLSQSRLAKGLRIVRPGLQWLSVLLLLLCIATGFLGNRDPVRNFSMPFFWIIFVLLVPYLTVLVGNFYAAVSPWQAIADGIGRLWRGYTQGRIAYPTWLGDWPALALYMGFIWFELFAHGRPVDLAVMLTAYTAVNLVGVWLVGAAAWFRHCEFFAVFLRLVGLLAPVHYASHSSTERASLRWRWPMAGLLEARPQHLSTVAFALAMLSTTAFDGLKATQWWVALFWNDPTGWLTQWAGLRPIEAIPQMRPVYLAWSSFWLLVSPLIYLGLFLLTVWLAKRLTGAERSVRDLALDFGYTLLPIAVVYHITHYATLLLSHGLKIISLASDPFGWRWDLFGTAHSLRAPILPEMGVVWHSQVGLILAGHIISVWIAHRVALRVFETRGKAMLSQLPMLALMVGFTVAGLWILAQPLTVMLLR